MAQKDKSVTLAKNGRKVTLTIPQDIVQYRAAGWREEVAEVPVADSPQDVTERPAVAPKSSEDPAAGANPRPASAQAAKGGAQK